MPFDPTLLTDPQTANAFGPQIQAANQAQNQSAQLAVQAQRQMQKEQMQSQRDAETAANEATKAAAQQAKATAKETAAQDELKMRRADRPFFTDAMGRIVPTQDDKTFAEEQQRKQAQAAEKLRRETVDQQMQTIQAEAGVRGRALQEKERADLEKQLAETRDGARYSLLTKLGQAGRETDKAGWYDVVNNNPTPAALTAQQRAQRLADPTADLDENDFADLEADPTTQPTAARLKALKQSLSADDEIRSYQKQTQQKLAELALLKADPARWEAYQREKMSKMDAATLEQHLSTTQEDLTRRAAELDAKRTAYEQPILATQAKFTELQRQNAEAVKQGVPAAELVTLEDGTHWHAPLFNEVSRLQAQDDARRNDPEQERQRQLLELEAADYNRQVNLLNEAGGLRQQKTETEAKTQADVRRFTPGMERSAQQVEQIKANAQQRIEAVNAQFPQDGPERQAAMQAIEADVTAQAQEAEAKGQQTQAAAVAAYQGIKQRLYTNPELKGVAGDLFVTARKKLAQALGIPEAEANNLLEDIESQDWSQIQGKHGETVPEGNAAQRFMTEAAGDKRQFRLLKNGGLSINPQITDPEAYAKAVEAAPASPEAKAAAMARQPDLRQRYGAQALETLQQIKAADWETFRSSQPKDLSPEEVAARYADKLKADTGTGEKVLRAIFMSMNQGVGDIGSQVLGGLSGITGSETLMKGATALNERSQLIEMDKQMRGAGGNFALDTLGQFSRLVPSLVPAAGGAKAAQVGLALFARTGIAARMLPGLVQGLKTAASPAQAARAAQMFSRAGVGGAAVAGGGQTYGAQLADIYAQLRQEHPEMDHATALRQAQIPAILSGAMTTALTIAGGATGVEKLLANPAATKEAFKKQFTSRMAQAGFVAKAIATGGVKEWPEEIADELFSTITSAAATGQSVPQALAQFAESLPELSAAIFMLGGAGEGIQAARESSIQAPPANIDATQPGTTAGTTQAAPPEVIEAAWASIENLDLPGVDPAEIEPMQTRASVALAVAQGGSLEDMEEDQLNAVGWTGRNSKGQTLPPGQIEKLKDYTGPEVLEVDTKGNASVSPRYLTALQQHLPPVAAAISASLSPTPATPSAQATAPATTPEADPQARRASVDGAASPATGGEGETQAGAGAVSPAPADTPEAERSTQLATHLNMLGLPPDQASAVADHLVEKQGVIGTSYLEQVIASDFPKALKALGITGSLSAAQSATNPLRAPADLSQRLASQKTAKAVTEDSPVNEQPTTVNEPQAPEPLSTAQPAASPAPDAQPETVSPPVASQNEAKPVGKESLPTDATPPAVGTDQWFQELSEEDLDRNIATVAGVVNNAAVAATQEGGDQGFADIAKLAQERLSRLRAEKARRAQSPSPQVSGAAVSQSAAPAPVSESPAQPSPSPQVSKSPPAARPKLDLVQEDRAQQLAAKLTRGGAYTDQEAVALAEEYVSKSAENGRSLNDQWRYGLIPWLARRETAARGGRLAKGKVAADNFVEATPDRPADLRRHPAWARNRLAALSSLPAQRRPAARQQLNALERALAANHALFSSIALGPKEIARSIIGEGSMAVQEMDGQIVLALDLGRMLAQMKNTTTPEAGMTASLVEEAIHAAVLRLAKKNPAKYGLPSLVKRWQSLTPELRQKVWESYHAVDIQNGTHSKTIPADMKDGQQWALMHEFLRMLVQDKAFAGQVSEIAAQDKNLAQWIVDALKDLAQALKDLIGKASPEVQTELNGMVDEIALTVKQFQALSAAQPFGKQPSTTVNNRQQSSTAPAPLANTTDNRASVLSGQPSPTTATNGQPPPTVPGSKGTAYTDANEPIEYQWAVVDVNDLNISNRDDGTISPEYPQELQPRDRTSAGSEAQVADIAKNFNLDRLSISSSVGDGAPIIGPDGVVESGNGRAMGGRRAYATGNAASSKYRSALVDRAGEFGLDRTQIEAVKNPVLVRVRTTDVNRLGFVLAANVSTIAPKRELEQAKIDAKQIVPDLFENFVPNEDGEVFTAANAGFIRDFVSAIIPPAERPAIMDAKGNLSQSGLRRLRNALFVHAYGDSADTLAALGTIAEDIEADGRNLVNTLIAIAPRFAEQNGRMASGSLYELSITEDLAKALTTYQDIKARGDTVDSWAAQDTLAGIGERPSDFQRTLVTALHEHRRKPRVLLAALDRYAKAIDGAGDPKQASLFGDEPRPTREELFALATGKTFTQEEAEGWRKLAEQPSTTVNNRQQPSTAPVSPPPTPPAPVAAQPQPTTANNSQPPPTAPAPQESIRPLSTVEAARLLQQKTGITDRDALAKAIETRLSLRPFAAQSMAEAILNDLAGTPKRPAKPGAPTYRGPLSRRFLFGAARLEGPGAEEERARLQFLADQRAGISPRNWEDSPWMDEAEYRRYAGGNARRMSLAKATTAIDWPGRPHIWKGSTTGGASMAILRRTPGGDYDIQIENDFSIWPAKNVMSITGLKKAELAALPDFPGRESPAIAPKNALKLYRTLTAQQKTKPLTAGQSKALEQAERSLGQLFLFDDAETSILKPAEDLVLEQQTTGRLVKNPEQLTLFMGNKALARPEESEWYQKNKARFDAEAEIFGTPPSAYIRAAFQAETNTGYTIDPLNPPSPWPDAAPPDFVNGKFTDWEQKVRDWEQRKADLSWSNTKVWFSGPLWYVTNYTYSGESSYVTYDSPIGQQQFRISNHAKPKDHATNQYFRLQYVGDSRAEAREWIKEKVLAAPDLNLKNREQAEAVQRLANERWTQARQTQNNEGQANQQLQELTFLYKTPRSLEIWKQWADEGFYSQAIPYDKVGLGQKSPATPSKLEKFRHLIRQKELKWAEKSQSTQATVLNAPEAQSPTDVMKKTGRDEPTTSASPVNTLFMATKRSLYSKAAKEKHLRPITRMLVKLRSGVQNALVRTVAETVLPRMSAPVRTLMDQAAADYDAWLRPKMAALKPQWDAYKKRYTPAIVDAYNEGLESLAAELGIMPMTRVPLKGDRGMEKAILDAEDESVDGVAPAPDVTRVNDVLRASLVAADDEGVARAVAALRARYKVVKFKDRFNKPAGGYHDWNFIIEVAPGLNAEVQVHRIDYLFSKELGPGHLMYEDWRRLDRLVKLNPAPEIARQYRRVSKAMEAYYTSIAQAFNMARKESSSISTPSLSSRVPSAIGRGTGEPRQVIGTGTSASMSQVAGSPSTSKNLVVGENVSGTFTPDTTTQTPNKQGVTITTANISDYAGAVDVTALQGRQKDWKQAFDYQPGVLVVPLSKLISHKNELEDPKFKAGLKKDPRQNAADWILKAMQGEPGAKKRAPLDVSTNPDGTYTIQDGNATAQALMLAGWKAVPINVVQAPALQKGRTAVDDTPDLFSFNTGLGLDTLLTPAQKERKLADSQQLDLFDEPGPRTNTGTQRTEKTRRIPRQAGAARQPAALESFPDDLFSQRDDGQRISATRFPGELGLGDERAGSGDIGDGVPGPTDQGTADKPANSVQGDPPGLSLAPAVIPTPADPADRNHRIDGSVAPKGNKAKLEANFAAMKLVRELEAAGRNPTPEEKKTLEAYTGWGWMKEAFNTVRAQKVADMKTRAERYINAPRPFYDRKTYNTWRDYYTDPSEEEQRLLNWADTYLETHERLRAELSEKEFHAAEKSTLNAHFTTPSIIGSMWEAIAKLGFKGGRAMEPGGGIGHFIGVQPEALAARTQWEATELDDVTARILAKLYPQARVNSAMAATNREVSGMGFQNARIPNNSLDLFISNVPFAKQGPGKAKSEFGQDFNLHNYFFARALSKVKPGGLIAFITTSNTMESARAQRDYLNNHGQLVAAVRLPNNAFKENAGTEVTTDIIILRKPDGSNFVGEPWRERIKVGEDVVTAKRKREGSNAQRIDDWLGEIDPEWIPADEALVEPFTAWMRGGRPASGQKRTALMNALNQLHGFSPMKLDFRAPIYVNEYFARHPENVLGTNRLIGSMYGPGEYTVLPSTEPLESQLAQFVDRLPEDIMNQTATTGFEAKAAERGDKVDSYVEREGRIYQVTKEGLEPVEWQVMPGMDAKTKAAAEKKTAIYTQWAKLREAAVALVQMEANPLADEAEMKAARALLNQVYDRTVEKYGPLSKRRRNNYRFLEDDPEAALLEALEDEDRSTDKAGKVTYTYTKTDIFRRRLIEPQEAPTTAVDLEEAVSISMAWQGTVNPQYVGDLLGTDAGLARQQLIEGGHAFEDPASGMLMTADEYLSGPVSDRLRRAIEAAKDSPQYERNVTALREALPPHKAISEASVILGQRWIPDSIYTAFARHIGMEDGTVRFVPELNSFETRGEGSAEDWIVGNKGAKDILDAVLNNDTLTYRRYERGEGMVVDEELTASLRVKASEMRDAFSQFVKTTEEKVPDTEFEGQQIGIPDLAERDFNQKVNGIKPPNFVGDWVKLPGQSGIIWLKPFRKAVLARLITQGRGMMAHGVGSGKTYNQIALAMELRRLGKARKPVIVVQNSTINQFAASFRKAYPQAKILVATPRSYNAKTRARFTARMATGDWDAIIMTHSNVDLIGHSEETVTAYFAKELEELDAALLSSDGSDQQSDLQKARDKLIEKRDEMMQALGDRQDDTLNWENIGVDALIVDEAHAFKNAPVVTNRGRDIKNIPSSGVGSQRAVSMMMKTRSVRERNGQKGVFFATGTPVSNSMAEAFIMLRYIAPDLLEANGIRNFDDFASQYGDIVSQAESTWDGKVKMVDRFAKFVNGQQLINLVRSVFDVAMGNESLGIDVPTVRDGKPKQLVVPATPANAAFNSWILREVSPAWERITRKDIKDNPSLSAVPIMTMQAGIAAALDPRLIHDNAPDDPNSKVNTAIKEVLRIYKEGKDRSTAQVIFSDLFNSFNMDILEGFAGQPYEDMGESRGTFNLGADIKAKLIAAGVPEKEIMVVTDQKDEALTNIFDKVNDGEIRVIIGSTGRLGVGVNIQERLAAVHHLMPPRDFKPAMMEQRNGRIIRQGNLHAEWRDIAFVDVVERLGKTRLPTKDDKGKALSPSKRAEAARKWLDDHDRFQWTKGGVRKPDSGIRAEAEAAARVFDIQIIEYGVEKSLDSAVYSMMSAKQGMIAQVLTADAVGNEFEDPSDEIRMSMAEMAAHTMGDPDMIRSVTVDKLFRELRAAYEGFQRMDSGRRSDVRRLSYNIEKSTAMLPRLDTEAERYGKLWEANEGKPVYEFGGITVNTAEKDAKITAPLNLWITENARELALKGQEERTASLIINGQPFNLTVKGEEEAKEGEDGGVYGFVQMARSDRYSNFSGGARGAIQALHRITENAATRAADTRQELAKEQKQLAQIQAYLAQDKGFPRMEELQALQRERLELAARINARNAPEPKPERDNSVRQGITIPPLAQADPDLLTEEVMSALEDAVITDNSLVLPDQLDRKLYEKVNKALESAGGVWSKRDKAHLFAGDPRPYLGLAPMPEGQSLQKGRVAPLTVDPLTVDGYTPPNDTEANAASNQLDRRTANPTRITGSRVSAEQGQALRDDHFARLLTGGLRPNSPAARSDFDWSPGPRLAAALAQAFAVPVLTQAQEADIRALPVNDDGVESYVYLDKANGVIYKKLKTFAEQPSGGIWPQVTWAGRSLHWHLQPANNPRAVGVRLAVMADLGGTPTEVAAIGPDGHLYLKQPLSAAPKIATDEGIHITVGTRHLAGLVEIPAKHRAGNVRAWIGIVRGRPWLVTDLHGDNFIGDNQGNARINDPVIGMISMDVLKNVPGLRPIVQQAAKEAAQLGDRANRLFMSNKALASPSATAQTSPMASTDGAAQSNEPSPGGLSEADARTPMTIYRAGDADEVGVKPFSSWTPEKETAVEYQDNPGFGGETLRQVRVDAGNVLEADTTSRRGMRDLAEALGFEPETGNDWFDNGWRYPWEESSKVKRALEESEFDAVQYTDDFPEGATTIIFTREPKSLNPSRAQSGTLAKATTSPTTVNNGQPSSTAQPSTSPPSPLAKLGWNHLDRSASAKLAALTRWMDAKTSASDTVAKWQAAPSAAPFMKFGHLVKRELFPDSILPREIAAAKREMEIKTAMGGQRAMDLVRALSGSPKFSDIAYPAEFAANPVWRQRLYSAMTGESPMSALPVPMQKLAEKLRNILIDTASEAVKQGRMSLDTFEAIREGYMPHYYQEDVSREKNLFTRLRLAVQDLVSGRESAWHITDTQARERGGDFRAIEWQPGKWRFRNQQHRDAHYEDFILQQALSQVQAMGGKARSLTIADLRAPAALPAETRGALDVIKRQLRTRYQKQEPLSIAAKQKAGLIMDPVYAVARYAAQAAHDNSTAEFFNFIESKPELIADVPTAGFTEIPENPRYGRLSGKYVEDDIARQLTEMIEAPGDALRLYDKLMGWWKTGKTVYNPGTHVRNVLGNVFFSQIAGNSIWNPGNTRYYADAIRALRNGGPDLIEAYEQGVLGADFVSVELRQTLRQLLPDPATLKTGPDGPPSALLSIGKSVGSFLHHAHNKTTALYQLEDEVFKLAAFMKAKDIFSEQGTKNEERGTMAAGHVRKWFPYFDSGSSTTLRALGRTAMPFLGFYRESIRIFGHALTERPLALAAGLAVPSIITALSAMALGLDDDELDEIKKDMRGKGGKLLGPTPLGGVPLFSMLLPTRSDQGQVQQFDISAIHPFVDFMGNRVEGGEGEDWWQKTWRSFVAAGPIGSLLYTQITGRETFGDRQIIEQNMTGMEKLTARADNLAKTVLPPLAPFGTGFQTLMNAGERMTNKTLEVRSPTQAVLRSVIGLDVRNATPDLYRIAEDWRKANGIPTTEGMDFGSTTPASRARKALFAQLAQPEPNLTAIANLKQKLKDMGQPMETDKEIQQLLFYRNPLMIIKGQDNQQRFRASLAPAQRAVLDTAIQEYNQIKARAPMLLRTAK